jgi:DNA end-binding protein Ku
MSTARPSWDGFLKFNLIAVPVKAYNATVSGRGKIGFHLVHRKCHSRIRYEKVCPIHGKVDKGEIASAYEFAKGQYVLVEPDEQKKLWTENEKAISIDSFVRPEAVDPIYFSGRTYYLVPDGRVAQKAYAVLQEVMAAEQRFGIAQVVFSGREEIAVVRPFEMLLAMTILNYADQIKKPEAFEADLTHPAVSAQERRLAESLIESSTTEDFDLGRYKDQYTAKLTTLLQARAKGKKIVTPRTKEEPAVINLMDALRRSLDQARKGQSGQAARPQAARKGRASAGRIAAHTAGKRRTG